MMQPETARLRGDSRAVIITATWLVGLLIVASFIMGVPGLVMVAGWAGLQGWMTYLAPIVLDAGLAIAALSAVVSRARHESARLAKTVMMTLAALSVAAQIAHVAVAYTSPSTQAIIGAVVAAAAPVMVVASTELLLGLAIAPPLAKTSRKARSKPPAPKPAPQPAQVGATQAVAAKPREPAPKPAKPATASAQSRAYTDADMEKAIKAILDGEGSYAVIASQYGVPTSTLKERVKKARELRIVA